jgi:hypothetical protein
LNFFSLFDRFELFLAFLSLEKGNFFGFGSKKLKTAQKSSNKLKRAQKSSKGLSLPTPA